MKKEVRTPQIKKRNIVVMLLVLFDYCAAVLSYSAALFLRFDLQFEKIEPQMWDNLSRFILLYGLISVAVMTLMKLYKRLWRYVSLPELFACATAGLVCLALHIALMNIFFGTMPTTYYVLGFVFQMFFTVCSRFSYRVFLFLRKRSQAASVQNVMIIGAGSAGQALLRDISEHYSDTDTVRCFIDDNPNKVGCYLNNVLVYGGRNEILAAVEKYRIDKIIFAIPSADDKTSREILGVCTETGCVLRQVPMMYAATGTNVDYSMVADVKLEDLLGRKAIKVRMDEVFTYIQGKVILVTGGGGSIGSELCRQIAAHAPKQLIIFDIYENNAHAIQLELKEKYPELDLVTLIGSVRDCKRVDSVFAKYRPELVFHAAAHKHVPLMEDSPCESIKNNVLGTYKTAYAAIRHGCRRFVLVSTDKAVNPTNIMGASKRMCEMVVQAFDRLVRTGRTGLIRPFCEHSADFTQEGEPCTEFVAVRFGNVLGSNGSVVPIFKKQIEKGGPVTVTHPDVIRYFMTVSEAVSLILQAVTYAHGGEIYVLDMGEPVKIDTLARNLIRLSGLRPDVDIPIVYTGLRPGEKLYEEKLMDEEGLEKTANDLIYVGHALNFDEAEFLHDLESIKDAAYDNDENIGRLVSQIVPTYKPDRAVSEAIIR